MRFLLFMLACFMFFSCEKKEKPVKKSIILPVASVLNQYAEKDKNILDNFEGLVFGQTSKDNAIAILQEQGFTLSAVQGNNADFNDLYMQGYLANIPVEFGLYFTHNVLTSLIFSVNHRDKLAFMQLMANRYGRPAFNETESNSYIWYFNNCAITYNQRQNNGLVEIHLFSAMQEGLQ